VIDAGDSWNALLLAFGLMLVLEGLLPFLSPQRWRALFAQAAKLTDGQLRFLGLAALVVGCAILLIAFD
jgi:uncharacterized protein YjeT (DUF2065 family)